ncbi:protein takeout-like [Macrosteles quadrilineatus]|uniref:protein takeout-like n=1 Tax=Macrosteles quadrilineatus TaxID=74068 RepID=UPI0023E0B1FC|nr:protein takeout-like [Macrosteles quadrilineatus]XP_054271513.1 protein takeout-like [Macrosteles quadrilineatus]
MRTSFAFVVLVAAFAPLDAGKLPSYIKACRKDDPKLNECAVKNGQAAIPSLIQGDKSLGIPKLDPLEIEKVVVGDANKKGGGGLGITFTCYKCKISGLKDLQLKDAKIDLKKKTFEFTGKVPKVGVKGRYTTEGRVLILPIKGNGTADLTLGDLNLKYRLLYDLVKGKDGKDHVKFKSPKLDFKVDQFKIKLTNLFNGDKNLGEQMNAFLNENWREVLKEFGPAVIEAINQIIVLITNSIAEKVPYDDIFLK